MNDLEHDLRTLLRDEASGAGVPGPEPAMFRRARRRQLGTVLGSLAVTAALVIGAVAGVRALAPSDRRTPGDTGDTFVDTTVNGITVTHPDGWFVLDPVGAGIEPSDTDLPRLVLWVSNDDPTSGPVGCPALADGAAEGFVMTLQQEPLALAGEGATRWPVELVPMEAGTTGPSCYPDWTFRRASWTVGGRTFEARVGVGPDVSEVDRQALDAAYASMRFAPAVGEADTAVVATGTVGGEDWELIAGTGSGGLSLTLQWSNGGTGIGGMGGVPDAIQTGTAILGEGDARTVVVFGSARGPIARVEISPAGAGAATSADVIDIPDSIGGRLNTFVATYPLDPADPGATLNAYDDNGELVATVAVTSSSRGG